MTENTLEKKIPVQGSGLQSLLLTLAIFVVGVLMIFMVVRHVQAADPYIQDVLALEGDAGRGQEIFQMNCAVCHGLEANGEVGPSLLGVSARKSKVNLIKQVVSGQTPPMPQFQPSPKDMADLLQYLEAL